MTTNAEKKARQKANREARLERAVREQEQRRQRQRIIAIVVLVVALAAIVGIIWSVSGDDGSDDASTTTSAPTTSTPDATPVKPECPPAEGAPTRTVTFTEAPPTCIDPAKTYTAELTTSKGAFTIALDAKAAPKTVNNFVFLARHRFYDGIPFHRIVKDFVIQGGDPTPAASADDLANLGGGGPGYKFDDELDAAKSGGYQTMSVAMANSGPNTNGSQFFVVLEGGAANLQPLYSLFGKVTSGADVVTAIGATPMNGEHPAEVVTIDSVKITES